MPHIILLSGPVGAGKSTVAQELVAAASGPTAYIEGDTFWSFIVKGTGQDRHADFGMIMRSMVAAAIPYALSGYEVIVDFSIPPWFLETARKIVQMRDVSLSYVVLRPTEAVCAARAAARPEGTIPDYAPYRELYSDFDAARGNIVADDASDAKTLTAHIREGLNVEAFRIL